MASTLIDVIRQKTSSTFAHIRQSIGPLKRLLKNEPITLLVLPHTGTVRRLHLSRPMAMALAGALVVVAVVLAVSVSLQVRMRIELAARESLLRKEQVANALLLRADAERSAALDRLREKTAKLQAQMDKIESLSDQVDSLLSKSQGKVSSALSSRGGSRRALLPQRALLDSRENLLNGGRAITLAPLSPLPEAEPASESPYSAEEGVNGADKLETTIEELEARAFTAERVLQDARVDLSRFVERAEHTPSSWPAYGRITSGFGYRNHPIAGEGRFHDGVDISLPFGTAVDSTGTGVIRYAGWESGYGLEVLVDHGYGYVTRYAHLGRLSVRVGANVKKGQRIGYSGNSGLSTGPHLHYEVIVSGRPRDPVPYLKEAR